MQKTVHIIDRIEHGVLVWSILGLAIFAFFQVFTRYLFDFSFIWFEEFSRYMGVFITFLGASIGAKKGIHFSMDMIVKILEPPYRNYLQFTTCIMSSAFFFLITFYTWKIIRRMFNFGSTSPAMGIDMYIAYLPILFFSVVMGVRFLLKGLRYIRPLNPVETTSLKGAPS
jgi:C4-dicarboxylate transporter DctQ subunit